MTDYIPVAIIFALTGIVVAVMVSLNRLLGPRRTRPESWTTDDVFECGNPTTGTAWARFSVKFYMVAILFIVFDLEVVFIYPWAVVFRELGMFGFVEMMMFVAILTVGLAFAWRKGALEWK
ncbi:MAG: NADH-quinone oxidoreductase subunit A [Myxococcales bacterium]|jgi:NADH-quinone oxidoreductase subunit A|nr:MAG: NADH-quinone oxidoreductase subunit A [Myxococcales bacterium]